VAGAFLLAASVRQIKAVSRYACHRNPKSEKKNTLKRELYTRNLHCRVLSLSRVSGFKRLKNASAPGALPFPGGSLQVSEAV